MNKSIQVLVLWIVSLLLPAPLFSQDAPASRVPANTGDFRKIIEDAKSKVFPALIFVAPVVEEFSGGKRETREQGGSGVIISRDGYAVTNWHVVEKALTIRILLFDGRVTTAEKIGEDQETDVALLKLAQPPKGPGEFASADLADSNRLTEGQFVMAMGAPWGLSRSVSLGILSSTTRYLPGRSEYSLWLQTDASINPGNSGGPLIDTDGKVVGINTLGSSGGGGDLGFAVPSNTVSRIIASLREHRAVLRSWTGIRLQPLNDFDRNTFFDGDRGVLIASVDEDSPALAAGVRVGDLLLSVGGKDVNGLHRENLPAINSVLGDLPLNRPVELSLRRGAEALTLTLTPRPKGRIEGEDFECKAWNMTVKAINEFATPSLFFYFKVGVYVQGIRQPGNAAESGLRRSDIILSIEGKEVQTLEDMRRIYEGISGDAKRERKVSMEVFRSGLRYRIVLDYSTKYKE
jgi:serine protease Do